MNRVLFVCIENSCRSQMAEGFFNKFSQNNITSVSAGTRPGTEVNPLAVEVMKEVGVDISNQKPKSISDEMMENAERIFTMGCYDACPSNLPREKTADWMIEDPSGKSLEKFREIRDIIKEKVEGLIEAIS